MSKKEMTSEAKAVQRLMKKIFTMSNVAYPLKEKTDNFFNKLVKELEETTDEEEKENEFNNHPRTIKKNLEFLARKFTDNPTNEELKTITKYVENVYSDLDLKFKKRLTESVKKKKKK